MATQTKQDKRTNGDNPYAAYAPAHVHELSERLVESSRRNTDRLPRLLRARREDRRRLRGSRRGGHPERVRRLADHRPRRSLAGDRQGAGLGRSARQLVAA
ncbi:MAG: hypothetical protein WKF31_13105 [Thermoleophilaceae bacterium]